MYSSSGESSCSYSAIGGFDEAERNKPGECLPVCGLDHEMGDRILCELDYQRSDVAAVPVGAADIGPEPKQPRLRHFWPPTLAPLRCDRQLILLAAKRLD